MRVTNNLAHGLVGVLGLIGLGFSIWVIGQVLTPIIGHELALIAAIPLLIFGGIFCGAIVLGAYRGVYPDQKDRFIPWP